MDGQKITRAQFLERKAVIEKHYAQHGGAMKTLHGGRVEDAWTRPAGAQGSQLPPVGADGDATWMGSDWEATVEEAGWLGRLLRAFGFASKPARIKSEALGDRPLPEAPPSFDRTMPRRPAASSRAQARTVQAGSPSDEQPVYLTAEEVLAQHGAGKEKLYETLSKFRGKAIAEADRSSDAQCRQTALGRCAK